MFGKNSGFLFTIPFCLLVFLFSLNKLNAQDSSISDNESYKKFYLGIGTGINAITGLIGPVLEFAPSSRFSFHAGGGVGSWGTKISGGLTLYTQNPSSGSSVSLSYVHARGIDDVVINLETVREEMHDVTMNLLPVGCVSLMFQYHIPISMFIKISVGAGYAYTKSRDSYEISSGQTISWDSRHYMNFIQPGGFAASLSLNFGFLKK